MICICRTEKIEQNQAIDIFVPVKGTGAYRLADRFHQKCEIHGIRDLTPPDEPATSLTPTEEKIDGKDDNEATGDA